jgi:hypothetical protein
MNIPTKEALESVLSQLEAQKIDKVANDLDALIGSIVLRRYEDPKFSHDGGCHTVYTIEFSNMNAPLECETDLVEWVYQETYDPNGFMAHYTFYGVPVWAFWNEIRYFGGEPQPDAQTSYECTPKEWNRDKAKELGMVEVKISINMSDFSWYEKRLREMLGKSAELAANP